MIWMQNSLEKPDQFFVVKDIEHDLEFLHSNGRWGIPGTDRKRWRYRNKQELISAVNKMNKRKKS